MENVRPEGTEEQYFISPSGEALEGNFHVRSSKCIRKSPHRHDPGFGAAREWNNYAAVSMIYMIQDGDLNINVDMDEAPSSLDEFDAEDFIDAPSMFHMRESYVIRSQIHDPDHPTYMEAISGENAY